jgi:hypothetical protein
MKIKYFAPSYKRPQKSSTQKLYPFIKLVVAESEAEEYINNGNDIVIVPDESQGNIARIRNYIVDNLMEDADYIVLMDDDSKGIYYWQYQRSFLIDKNNIEEFCEINSILCDSWGYKFWGLNILPDKAAYREHTPFSTVQYIGAPFQAHSNKSLIRYDEKLPLKEDYDITLQHLYKYGGCLRVNYAFYRVLQAEQTGGCALMRSTEKEESQFNLLQNKWGDRIIQSDKKSKREFDFNPIMHSPIKGV